MKLFSSFYKWFVPHFLLLAPAEQGLEHNILGHLQLRLW